MLDVSLHGVSFSFPRFALRDLTVTFPRGSHTAIAGDPGCGASTLLRLIAGHLVPAAGEVRIGTRVVNRLRPSRRPLLHVTSSPAVPERWSVQHALIAAVRTRSLDRVDRQREYALAAERWKLEALLDRPLRSLSSSERTYVHLARIELLRPGIVVADRLLEHLQPSALPQIAHELYRLFRVTEATVISALSSLPEMGHTDRVLILDAGRIAQMGSASSVFARPATPAAARALGDVNVVPVSISGRTVSSIIGQWEVGAPPFQGPGVALARPGDFRVAGPGEESDLIFGVEEAFFDGGSWLASGLLSGAFLLRILLPGEMPIHKGKLLPVRYDPHRFALLPGESRERSLSPPLDIIPPLAETR